MTQLVQIKPAPPLRQSLIETLACPRSYKAIVIDGLTPPPSPASDRGDDVHHVHAVYTMYCVKRQIPADWEAFDRIAEMAGPEASEILEGVRENYEVDWEHTTGTEVRFELDENFQPSGGDPAYAGTRDVDTVDGDAGGTIDWKSHIRPFPQSDVPNVQSDMYALSRFQENDELQKLTFRFRFVRYAHCERVAEYTRADIPALMAKMEAHRRRQLAIHAHPEKAEAIPSKQCLYCPLLNGLCPISPRVNPWAQADAVTWTKRLVYLTYAMEQAKQILREHVQASGAPIEYTDGKGERYIFGPKAIETQEFPLIPTMQKLLDYRHTEEENPTGKGGVPDVAWIANLRVGATKLKQYLRPKKRAFLHQSIMDTVAVKVTKTPTRLHRPDDEPEEEGEDEK